MKIIWPTIFVSLWLVAFSLSTFSLIYYIEYFNAGYIALFSILTTALAILMIWYVIKTVRKNRGYWEKQRYKGRKWKY